MTLKKGDKAITISLPEISGEVYNTGDLSGSPYLLSFYRFATCPFCNLRVYELIKLADQLNPNFKMVAIFDSPLAHLKKHAGRHHAPFPILADETRQYYRQYGIKNSLGGMLKGMITRPRTLIKGMAKGYITFPVRGSLATMPADFLIDKEGIIHTAYYGKDEGDHLAIEIIREFSMGIE